MTRIVVCDAGPLLHLSEIGAIHLLSLAGDILIPPQVAIEFKNSAQNWNPPQGAQIVSLENTAQQKAANWMEMNQIDALGSVRQMTNVSTQMGVVQNFGRKNPVHEFRMNKRMQAA